MDFCTAKISLGGDDRNIMTRDRFNPVSWPEIEIIRLMHGEQSVSEVSPFVRVNQAPRAERERLALIYGEAPLMQCWGGKNPPHEMEAPGEFEMPKSPTWLNPITGRVVGQVFPFVPPTNQAETVGDMSKDPAPVGENDTAVEGEEDDFGGDQMRVPARRKR
jgi:hypothetical protein